MASIPNISAAGANAAVAAPGAPASKSSDIQDRFLKLLVTQMKNQDPLNPLDNAQVTSQLAQINTVNGIEALNVTLKEMSTSFLAGQSMQSASLIGRTVLTDGNSLALTAGAPAQGGVQLERAADSVTVTVNGPAGNAVRQIELGQRASGLLAFDWDGRNDAGAVMAPGAYTFQVNAIGAGQKVAATPVASGTVSSVVPGSNGARVTVDGLGELTLQQIRNIK
jgi:flagellar basal-body rod modification protein FlgD